MTGPLNKLKYNYDEWSLNSLDGNIVELSTFRVWACVSIQFKKKFIVNTSSLKKNIYIAVR